MLPGGVDVHTHLDVELGGVRTADDFETCTAAAACGGVTTICDYAWQSARPNHHAGIETWQAKAEGRAHVDYGFHVVVSDASTRRLAQLPRLVAAGYPSFKVFIINEFASATRRCFAPVPGGAGVRRHRERALRERDMLDYCARGGAGGRAAATRATTPRAARPAERRPPAARSPTPR